MHFVVDKGCLPCYTTTCSDSERLGGIAQLGERLNGIQEVSGSIPLISTIEALKTIGFQGFLLFRGTFILPGTFLTRVLTRITKCPKNPICFQRLAVRFLTSRFFHPTLGNCTTLQAPSVGLSGSVVSEVKALLNLAMAS